ncbi:MAG: HD domain-containing protein, partial [Candidatus Electrothrix sp. ATG1]|nr:HD domain-containing protein [Candidatus Electrothrix sp. ATG1]
PMSWRILAMPDNILHKPRRLSDEEFKAIQKHTELGLSILQRGNWFELAQQIAYSHHERWDGSGYPLGLKGEEIPVAARIVSVADVFDALTHKRVYKTAWTLGDAVEEIQRCAGTQFDPKVVQAFTALWKEGELSEDSLS